MSEFDELVEGSRNPDMRRFIRRLIWLLRERFGLIDRRLDMAAEVRVVATIGDLPATAEPREFFRIRGDPFLYIGNGPTLPLRKLPTQPL